MGVAIAIAGLVVAVAVGFWTVGFAWSLLVTLLTGLLVGVAARALLPGRQELTLLTTAAAGVGGSMAGNMIAHNVLHIDGWLGQTALAVGCATALVAFLARRA